MTRFLKGTDRPLAEAYQLALLDLDGVVYRGKNPVEYAADSIRAAEAAGMTIEYTTNNSSRFQHVVADQLKGFGLDVEPWQVITSSVVAARMVAKALPAGARVQVLGAEHLRDEVTRNGRQCAVLRFYKQHQVHRHRHHLLGGHDLSGGISAERQRPARTQISIRRRSAH